jgi:putative restriction endonuclease
VERSLTYFPSSLHAWYEALAQEPRAKAVYKPALLLVVLDLLDEGRTSPERVVPDDALVDAMDALLKDAELDAPPGVAWQPFFHLGTTKSKRTPIWTLHDHRGAPLRVTSEDRPNSLRELRTKVAFAAFAPELAAPLWSATERASVRRLVYEWLERRSDPDARALLREHDPHWDRIERRVSELRDVANRPFELHGERTRVELAAAVQTVRDRAFRRAVLDRDAQRCAACELRLRWNDLFEAEAAHIIPVNADGTDDVRNGLTLCRTHHWAFDTGLWAVGDDRRLLVVDAPDSDTVDLAALRPLHGRPLVTAENSALAPHPEALAWHREHRFLGEKRAA